MPKLTIMRGLPASGKSTMAKELMEKSGNAVRVNKDLIREMLHFSKFTGKNENLTWLTEHDIALTMLTRGKDVIVDDTNLNESTFQSWVDMAKNYGHKHEVVNVNTDWKECIERDSKREKSVGKDAILDMAFMSGKYDKYPKGTVIYDIDGTLADVEHRRHHVLKEPKDWKGFFADMDKDTVRPEVVEMLKKDWDDGYMIVLVSGRSDDHKEFTKEWLLKNNIPGNHLFMRRSDDRREDTEVKRDIYEKYLKHYNVVKVVDDRPSVIRMWKEQGLEVVDVGDGIEF